MEFGLFCFITILFYFPCISSTTFCEKTYFYKYIVPNAYPFGYGHLGRGMGCTYFSHNTFRTTKITESVAITCSNVQPNVFLNHTYLTTFYDQDLVIVNSTIRNFPSNSSLSGFATIRKLVLRNLNIETISPGAFNSLEILKSLDLSSNELHEIPEKVFNDLSTLYVLNLSHNRINNVKSASISGLVQLKEFYLNENELTLLQEDIFKDLILLEILDVSDNPLENFKDVGFKSLKKLVAKNTHLKQFEVDLSNLEFSHCDFSGSYLESVNFNSLDSMHKPYKYESAVIIMNHNKISEIEKLPRNITDLDLSYNQINDLIMPSSNENNSLVTLDLSFNKISKVSPRIFWNLQNLKVLKLQHNEINILAENTFVNCSSLENIDLSHNQISKIENIFSGVHKLGFLNISHNNLINLNFAMLPNVNNLRILDISYNEIGSFNSEDMLHHLSNLKEISLNYNPWSCEVLTNIVHSLNVQNIAIADAMYSEEHTVKGIICEFNKKS